MPTANRRHKVKTTSQPQGLAYMAGDLIERLGEFVTRAGSPEWGQKLYRYGNRLENSNGKKAQHK